MEKICFVICLYISFIECIERSHQEINASSSKMLSSFHNFEACVENFEIHKDKIIRTEDSRAMGAKYVSEMDMNTIEDCLRLCCVTDTCDVFVFEEKTPGSCYLFNCGSSSNFKCKFTKHRNYSSGVLTLSQLMGDAQELDFPSKHEQELSKLRKPGDSDVNLNSTSGSASNSQEMSRKWNKTMDQNSLADMECSLIQFKCRTSGECIAVYNTCDGVPQCSDASDEYGCFLPVTSSLTPMLVSSRNKMGREESVLKQYEHSFHLQSQKDVLQDTFGNVRRGLQPGQTVTNGRVASVKNHPYKHENQLPESTKNILELPVDNRKESLNKYQSVYHQTDFMKKDNSPLKNSPSEFSGFHQNSNQQEAHDSEKLDERERDYLSKKLLNGRNNIINQNNYYQKPENVQMKSNYYRQGQVISDQQQNGEETSTFQNSKHMSKIHPVLQTELKEDRTDLTNAVHQKLTSMHVSQIQPHQYGIELPDEKDAKSQLHNYHNPPEEHTTHFVSQDTSMDESKHRNDDVQTMRQRQLGNDANEQLQDSSFVESRLQNVPGRSYKYDGDRNIFNHKGYGLVADSDSSELSYRTAVPGGQYKVSNAQRHGYIENIPSYGNQLHQNLWSEKKHLTSHAPKNPLQQPDTEGGYPVPSDYLYDEGSMNWNAASLVPHPSSTDHRLPTSSASSIQARRPLERPAFMRGVQNHQGHSYDIKVLPTGSETAVLNDDVKPHGNSQDSSIKNIKSLKNSIRKYVGGGDLLSHIAHAQDTPKHNHVSNHHREYFVSLQQADVSESSSDTQQDRPNGALLSMTFGLCVTIIMVVLVACRLRVVKRRLRRNGKSLYAHDADYLVNGMYL